MDADNYLVVISGPTAVGKTNLSIKIAQYFNTEIISADSRQFYKEMNIGTAKPSKEELSMVNHYFVNTLHIDQEYTVGMYEREVLTLLGTLFKEKKTVVLTGGSGLFIKAVCDGLDNIPEVPPSYREQLNKEYEGNGLSVLLKELQNKDPEYYEKVDKGNPVRIIRALEICRGTGKPFSSFQSAVKKERFFKTIKVGLTREREELYKRIDSRMDEMLLQGLEEEAKGLYEKRAINALQTVGYSEIFDYIDGTYDYAEMVRLLKRNSRHYAKRQLTWFTKDKEYKWFHPDQEVEIIRYIESCISER